MTYPLRINWWHNRCDKSLPTSDLTNFQFHGTEEWLFESTTEIEEYFQSKGYIFDWSAVEPVAYHLESDTLIEVVHDYKTDVISSASEIFDAVQQMIAQHKAKQAYWQEQLQQFRQAPSYHDFIH